MDRHKKQDIQACVYVFGSYFVNYMLLTFYWKIGEAPQNYKNFAAFWWILSPLTAWFTCVVYLMDKIAHDIMPFLARLLW